MKTMMDLLTVRKLNLNHELVIAYDGVVLERTSAAIVLEARFGRETMDLGYAVLEHHDRFVEHFFADRCTTSSRFTPCTTITSRLVLQHRETGGIWRRHHRAGGPGARFVDQSRRFVPGPRSRRI